MGFELHNRPMTAQQLAERWQTTAGNIRKLANKGELPFFKFGTALRFRVADIEALEAGVCASNSIGEHDMPSGQRTEKPGAPRSAPKIVRLPSRDKEDEHGLG